LKIRYRIKSIRILLLVGGFMSKRSQRMHNHKWILDKNNFGKCQCGATKQFPVEEIENGCKLATPPKYDPDSWLNASCDLKFNGM
jgi:hypothetical protein